MASFLAWLIACAVAFIVWVAIDVRPRKQSRPGRAEGQ